MSKIVKLEEKELEVLREYQSKQNNITFNLGNVDIQKAIANLQEESNKTAKELQDKYGDGNIDLETGEFTIVE